MSRLLTWLDKYTNLISVALITVIVLDITLDYLA